MNCISPLNLPRPNGNGSKDRILVPCTKCVACLSNKRNVWAFRLEQELKVSQSAHFITLTYDEHSLIKNGNWPTLSKFDVQLFLKRLRKSINSEYLDTNSREKVSKSGLKMRYFICGEYGTLGRPHYHGIFFNLPFRNDQIALKELNNLIETTWRKGYISIGTVTSASIRYTTKYMLTKFEECGNVEKPFLICSTKPAIGVNYLTRAEWHLKNEAFYSISEGGYKVTLARYYRDRIFNKEQIKKNSKLLEENYIKTLDENKVGEYELAYKEQLINRSKKLIKKDQKL